MGGGGGGGVQFSLSAGVDSGGVHYSAPIVSTVTRMIGKVRAPETTPWKGASEVMWDGDGGLTCSPGKRLKEREEVHLVYLMSSACDKSHQADTGEKYPSIQPEFSTVWQTTLPLKNDQLTGTTSDPKAGSPWYPASSSLTCPSPGGECEWQNCGRVGTRVAGRKWGGYPISTSCGPRACPCMLPSFEGCCCMPL